MAARLRNDSPPGPVVQRETRPRWYLSQVLVVSLCIIGLVLCTTIIILELTDPLPAARTSSECLVVWTLAGKVRGKLVQYNITDTVYSTVAFYGIPFAEPPVGRNRFMVPKCAKPHSGVFDATYKRPPCKQPDTHKPRNYTMDISNTTEDCLHINVWLPGTCANPGKAHAVVFWLHGSAFAGGVSSYDFYDGRFLSGLGNLVVAVPNYRVSLFGFLNSGTGHGVRGNMGLHDQVLALRWVRDNIGHFGGDRDNILVAGDGAGATSLTLLMASPLGSPSTFNRAYLLSGTVIPDMMSNAGSKARATFEAIADATQCQSDNATAVLRCLQERNASALLEASEEVHMQLTPSREGPLLPADAVEIGKRDIRHLQVMMSNTLNEATSLFQTLQPQFQGKKQAHPKETIRAVFKERFGGVSDLVIDIMFDILKEKHHDVDDPDYKGWVDLIDDMLFRCPAMSFATKLAKSGATVYYYIYEPKPSSTLLDGDSTSHGEDVLVLFGTVTFLYPELGTAEERATTLRMIRTLSNFANNGSVPKLVDGSSWPAIHNGSNEEIVRLTHDGYSYSSSPDHDCLLDEDVLKDTGLEPVSPSQRAMTALNAFDGTLRRVAEELMRLHMRHGLA
ncbi:acetylcholinesterase-1-like [Dermacentor variabilis]|uniref:acetylcholinesterase-1-like n=1 Tax=Dermacentor variabilis TaxID=34621 RepID=UPI003F5B3FDB